MALLQAAPRFHPTMKILNGTITNDKFCMSRRGRLQLSWWRLSLRARNAASKEVTYPSEGNNTECCSQEDTHETTTVDGSASPHGDSRRPAAVGSRLPVSCPMESRGSEGTPIRTISPGEQ